jgi:hypothetical protein
VLLWINGPFGGGKTQTAHEIQRRLPGSVICDPEEVGFGLHRMTPSYLRHDFQDHASWRQGVFEVLDRVASEHAGVVIAPMTVVEPKYFQETVGRLRDRGHDVKHFALIAERPTVVRRLRERGLAAGNLDLDSHIGHALQIITGKDAPLARESFAVSNLDRCLERLSHPEFAEHVWTDRITVSEVAERIATSAGLTLTPNTDSALRGRLRRAWTGARHIRFG